MVIKINMKNIGVSQTWNGDRKSLAKYNQEGTQVFHFPSIFILTKKESAISTIMLTFSLVLQMLEKVPWECFSLTAGMTTIEESSA